MPLSRRRRLAVARHDKKYVEDYQGLYIYQTEEDNKRVEERLDNCSDEELANVMVIGDMDIARNERTPRP